MIRKRTRKLLPATLVVAGCSAGPVEHDAGPMDSGIDAGRTDAGTDAGYDAGCAPNGSCTLYVNACGMNCGCLSSIAGDGGLNMLPYCDPDIGNPCALGCFNPKEADGGRVYNGPQPACLC
ncbi:MAG: hypothetical protein IPJ65_09355 [Archangiaceae bacterium]|nr:hypothetical protein [Archangiaceae bacterium]